MTILVTGGTGFLGSHLIEALLAEGHSVRVLARSTGENEHVDWIQGSILDVKSLKTAMSGCSAVYHLAGRVDRDRRAVKQLRELHVGGTRAVCEMGLELGIERLVYASTSGVIAVSKEFNEEIDESYSYPADLVESWPYYLTKLEAEKVALEFATSRGLPLVSLNPSLLLGPGDSRGSSTGDIADILAERVPAIPSGSINFVDVRDVTKAAVSALQRGRVGERYLLGGANWSLKTFIQTVAELGEVRVPWLKAPGRITSWAANFSAPVFERLGRTPPLDPVAVEMSRVHWCFSSDKAKEELDFRTREPRETLRDTIHDLRRPG